MQKLVSFVLLIGLLSSCSSFWKEDIIWEDNEKKDFFVDVIDFSQLDGSTTIKKVGQVNSSQDISLSSNANGRVSTIWVKVWDNVLAQQVIARLDDSIGNYGINLQRSDIWIERAQIQYDSTKLSWDKQIFDAQQNLQNLERNLDVALQDTQQNLFQAQNDLNNSQYDDLDTAAALWLVQLDNNIEKARLEYDIKIKSDAEQILTYIANTKKEFQNIRTQILDTIDFSDEILGITDLNKRKNDSYEDFLGANDMNQKRQAEIDLRDLIILKDDVRFQEYINLINVELSENKMQEIFNYTGEIYEKMLTTLIELETTLNNSIVSVWVFSAADVSANISRVNILQSQVQGSYTGFISTRSTIRSFLSTYKDSQQTILQSIALQEKDRDIKLKNLQNAALAAQTWFNRTTISVEDTINTLRQNIKTSENNLANALANQDVSLRSLENSIADARVWYASAAKEFNKLTIISPISGTIAWVKIDVGQEIGAGTLLFEIVSDGNPEVQVAFSDNEKDYIFPGQKVIVSYNNIEIEGKIYAISDVADSNLNYSATIVFESGINIIGSLVDVYIPLNSEKKLIPVNIVNIQGNNIWYVKTLSGSEVIDVRVRLWAVYGNNIEIISCAKNCIDLRIITSDISNYTPNNFVIQEK